MSDQPEIMKDHTYAKLRILSEAAKHLEDNWDKMSFEDRDKEWWLVHKASRDVWNLLHPPKKGTKRKFIEDAVNAALKDRFKGGVV